jgi:uncharacterized protein
MKTSNYVIYIHVPETDEYYLVHGYSGAVDKVSPSLVSYLIDRVDPNHTWHIKDMEHVRETLLGRAVIEPTPEAVEMLKTRGYLTEMSSPEERTYVERLAGFLHRKKLETTPAGFMFVPSYECNLRCPYCFETDTRVQLGKLKVLQNVMTPEMVDAAYRCMDIIDGQRFADHPERIPQRRSITLYGGEPLASENLGVVEYILKVGLERGYSFSAITNGVDLHDFMHLLGPGKISFLQITLDGPKAIHDRKRIGPRHKGGTFDRIVANIKTALATGVRISCRYHVDFNNVSCTRELAEQLKAEGLHEHENFVLYTYPIHMFHRGVERPEKPLMAIHDMHKELRKLSEESAAERETLAARAAETGEEYDPLQKELRLQMPDDGIAGKLKAYLGGKLMGLFQGSIEPCAATTGLYIFDPFWKIYTCWDSVGMAGHQTGSYSPEGPVFNDLNRQWLDRSPATIEQCKDCKYAFMHFGGCASLPVSVKGSLFEPACYDFQDNFVYAAQKFFRYGLEMAMETPTLPAAMQEAGTAVEAGMAGD